MGKKLKICTAIRNKDLEDSIIEIIQSQNWKHSFVNTDDIIGDNRKDTLVFIIEDSYSSILNFIEKHNSSELNFLPTIILSAEDSHHSEWVRYVKYPEKYFHTGTKHFSEVLVQVVKTMNAFRNSYDFRKLFNFRETVAKTFQKKSDDFKCFINAVLPDMLELLYADRGSIMLLNSEGNLVIEASSKKELVGLEVTYKKESVAWTVMDTKKPVFVEDIENDPRFKKSQGYLKDYFLSIPIFTEDEIAGVLNLSDKTISLLFDQTDYESANTLLDILEPYVYIKQKFNK